MFRLVAGARFSSVCVHMPASDTNGRPASHAAVYGHELHVWVRRDWEGGTQAVRDQVAQVLRERGDEDHLLDVSFAER